MSEERILSLSGIFGDCPDVKILECFADYYEDSLSVEDIVYMSDIPRTTVYRKIKKLVEKNILIKTRRYGKTQLYKLNMENDIAKSLAYLEILITQRGMEEIMKEEGVEIPHTIGKVIDDKNKIKEYVFDTASNTYTRPQIGTANEVCFCEG